MAIQWNPPSACSPLKTPLILNIPPGKPTVLSSLGGNEEAVTFYTHYLREQRRSVPCEGEECAYCDLEKTWKAIIPVAVYRRSGLIKGMVHDWDQIDTDFNQNCWKIWALQITRSASDLIDELYEGCVFQMGRIGKSNNGRLWRRWPDKQMVLQNNPGVTFDPRHCMVRAWRGHVGAT